MGPKLARPVPAEVTEALLSAQITATAGERSGFQIAFDLTKTGIINQRLLPEGFFDPKTRIIVTVSVRGTPDVLFDGLIVRQEVGASNQPGHSTLTVTGEDLTLLMDLEERTARYPNLPPSERVLAILRRYSDYGVRPDVYAEKVAQPPHQDLRVHYQTGTDLQYVTDLARANGYTFYLEPGPNPGQSSARWGPEVRLGIRQHALNVNMDANTTVDQLTFAYDGTAREEPQARWQDPGTRQSTLLPQPPISPLRPPLGRLPPRPSSAGPCQGRPSSSVSRPRPSSSPVPPCPPTSSPVPVRSTSTGTDTSCSPASWSACAARGGRTTATTTSSPSRTTCDRAPSSRTSPSPGRGWRRAATTSGPDPPSSQSPRTS